MKRISIVLSAIFLSSLSLWAQSAQESSSSLRLNWGMGKIKTQDLIYTPVLHEEWSPFNLAVTYSHSHRLVHRVYVKFSRYTPSVVEPYTFYWDTPDELSTTGTHQFNILDLNYSLGRPVLSGNKLSLVLGAGSRNRLHQSSYGYGPDWLSHFGYYFSFGLDIWSQMSCAIGNSSRLSMNLALPLFAYITRSPYMGQNDDYFENAFSHKPIPTLMAYIKDGEFQSWGQSKSLDFDLSYEYGISEKWSLGATYWLSMNFNSYPVPFRSVEQIISLSATFNF